MNASMRAGFMNGLCWAAMFGLAESWFALFAAHLKAPTSFFALLAGLPALLGPLTQVLSANLLERIQNRRRMILYAVFSQALLLLPLAAVPLLLAFQSGAESGSTLHAAQLTFLLIAICYFVAGSATQPAWVALIGVLVPSQQRADYFARFTRGTLIVTLAAKLLVMALLFIAGLHADLFTSRWHTSLVFGCLFGAGAIARFASSGACGGYMRRPMSGWRTLISPSGSSCAGSGSRICPFCGFCRGDVFRHFYLRGVLPAFRS